MLRVYQVVEIYMTKLNIMRVTRPCTHLQCARKKTIVQRTECQLMGLSAHLSHRYKVSPKTIRDIWSHRTWKDVTRPLWPKKTDTMDQTEVSYKEFLMVKGGAAAGAGGGGGGGSAAKEGVTWDWCVGQLHPPAIIPPRLPLMSVANTLDLAWWSLTPLQDPFHDDWAFW